MKIGGEVQQATEMGLIVVTKLQPEFLLTLQYCGAASLPSNGE